MKVVDILKTRNYKVVDAFTSKPLIGNPVAVILDSEGLDTSAMQRIARWTNLSETTFVSPPTSKGADYKLRIFTPQSELPFAGHPTLGSAYAVIEAGLAKANNGKLVQECEIGLVELAVKGEVGKEQISFALPNAKLTQLQPEDVDELEKILGSSIERKYAPTIVNVGAVWAVAKISSVEILLKLNPDFGRSKVFENRLGLTGLTVFAEYEAGDKFIEVRSFAPSCGVNEDPVCGSGNGSVGVFMYQQGIVPSTGFSYQATQGVRVGRDGQIEVAITSSGAISIGGNCVTCVSGQLTC